MKVVVLVLLAAAYGAGQNVRTEDGGYLLKAGTRIPLAVLNTVSSRNAAPGQQVYLQTIVPVVVGRRIVIPAGSHVTGTITQAQRPGRVAGRGDLYLRFDTLLLPGGAAVDLRARIGSLDGAHRGRLSGDEGKITSEGGATRDAWVVGLLTAGGALMGAWIGHRGTDAAIGAGAGGGLGLGLVLLSRGPEAMLHRGSTLEMVLHGDLKLAADEIGGR
jgi:type IV secretion system protein VirB10